MRKAGAGLHAVCFTGVASVPSVIVPLRAGADEYSQLWHRHHSSAADGGGQQRAGGLSKTPSDEIGRPTRRGRRVAGFGLPPCWHPLRKKSRRKKCASCYAAEQSISCGRRSLRPRTGRGQESSGQHIWFQIMPHSRTTFLAHVC